MMIIVIKLDGRLPLHLHNAARLAPLIQASVIITKITIFILATYNYYNHYLKLL